MVKTFDLSEKTVLITGGYGFLGSAIVESLLFHGAKVYVLGRNETKFNESFSAHKTSENLHFASCDVSSSSSIEAAIEKVFKVEMKCFQSIVMLFIIPIF